MINYIYGWDDFTDTTVFIFMAFFISMCSCVHGGAVFVGQRPTSGVCLYFLPYLLRQALSLNLDLTNLARLVLGYRYTPL